MCEQCDVVLLAVVGVAFVGSVVVLHLAVSFENRSAQSSSLTLAALVGSQLITVLQLAGIMHSLTVPWPEPFLSLLSVAQVFHFNVDVLRANCAIAMPPL